MASELNEEQLRALFAWIDAIPLSRPKRNITRDFSDGVLLAEVIHAYFPQLVELHNYTPASSIKQKIYNFETLNKKVLRKFGYTIDRQLIEDTVNCKPGAVESVLNTLQFNMAKYREKRQSFDGHSTGGSSGKKERDINNSNDSSKNNSSPVPSRQSNNNNNNKQPSNTANTSTVVQNNSNGSSNQEKDNQIRELQETIEILELKVSKLEQLVRLKDLKIQKLSQQH